MPRHKQVTTCRKTDGPVSKHCSCEHCTLAVCSVCGGGEGSLTSDCPGVKIDADRQQEIYETQLDYTDDRGWHLSTSRRSPRFEHTVVPAEPPRADPRALIAPTIDWGTVDRIAALQHELSQKAVAWAVADRIAEDSSAICTRLEDELDAIRNEHTSTAAITRRELQDKLKHATVDFRLTSQRAERCDDEFRQMARRIVTELEGRAPAAPAAPKGAL